MAKYRTDNGERYIESEAGYGWSHRGTQWVRHAGSEPLYTLEKRRRRPADETYDTGWYLYTPDPDGPFGEFCGSNILDAVDEADQMIEFEI